IAHHPQMSALITDEDEDMQSYMIHLEVEEVKHPVHLCKIMLLFQSNPYFQNKVITKEYLVNITEYRASHSTPIDWYPDYEVEAYHCRHHNRSLNFNWFSDHNFAGSNRTAEILCKDLWRNPLQYYKRMKPPEEGTEISGYSQMLS
ncbi:LOW QUALITY PROTEIN: TSPY2 isoform 4, partial [Pan troglodytes]